MTDSEEKDLIALARGWQKRTCMNAFGVDDCGDTDCMALRNAARDLINTLNILRINRAAQIAVGIPDGPRD